MSVSPVGVPSLVASDSSSSDNSEEVAISRVAKRTFQSKTLESLKKRRTKKVGLFTWAGNKIYRIGLSILSTALYPFSNRSQALYTYSCLEEFLDPFCVLSKDAEVAIYRHLLNDSEVCVSMQKLIDRARENNEQKVLEKYNSLVACMKDKENSETLLAVAADVKELGLLKKKLQDLPSDVSQMKICEEKKRWQAVSKVRLVVPSLKSLNEMLECPTVMRHKVARIIANLTTTNQSGLDLSQLEEQLDELTASRESILRAVSVFLAEGSEEVTDLIVRELEYVDSDIEAFQTALEKLSNHISAKDPNSTKRANREMTRLFRAVLESNVYKVLRHDPDNLMIGQLHRLAVAVWNDVRAVDAYRDFGAKILGAVGGFHATEAEVSGEDVTEYLTATHEVGQSELYSDLGWNYVGYGIRHPKHVAQSMASEGGMLGSIANLVGHAQYDPHLLASNTPSLQGVASCRMGDRTVKINNCYGGSPTVGTEISPEFLAVLQAVENNRYATSPNNQIPNHVFYINLQNINQDEGEFLRSRVIMELNFRFPRTFTGITLPKDSDFYRKSEWVNAEEFEMRLRSILEDKSSMSLNYRTGLAMEPQDEGYYFPPHEPWSSIFDKVLPVVTARFTNLKWVQPHSLAGAYQEYFYTLLQCYLEVHIASKRSQTERIMAIRACKENIDRGGMENTKYIYYHLGDEYFTGDKKSEGMALITGVFHSRALSARQRMIHMSRTQQTFELMRQVSRAQFREDLALLGVDSIHFTPILDS